MSETETELPSPEEQSRPSRLLRFFLRHVPLGIATILVAVALVAVGLYLLMSSSQFEGLVRKRIVAALEQVTGGHVEIASFHWRLLHLEAEADGVVIHGREAEGEAPYAQIDSLRAGVSVLGLWSPNVSLRDLEIAHPALHFIVYSDGSTNQPHPRQPQPSTHGLDTLFNLQASHLSVERGMIDYDNRAAAFDFQNRWEPLDFQANDVSLIMRYVHAGLDTPETYRIEAGATDINLSRSLAKDVAKRKVKPVHGYFQATLDLTHAAAYLRSFRLIAKAGDGSSHALEFTGSLQDFTHPHWQAKALGDLDMKLLDPVFGFPFAPEGIAHLDLNGAGEAGEFRTDGTVHIDGGSYIGTGVVATGLRVDTHVHADQNRLLISSIVAHLRQGGQLEGVVDLSPWLATVVPGTAVMQAASTPGARNAAHRNAAPALPAPLHPPPPFIPVNGKVTALLKGVSLDTILDMVSAPPFQRLGINGLLNGPAIATWSKGDTNTVAVNVNLNMSPLPQPLSGEVAGSGVIDATYTQRNGAVDLNKFDVHLPNSQVTAHGTLGAYPLTSPSAFNVDFNSHDLGEFDTVLRSLGLERNGKSGTAALPIALTGQADFHGSWAGSLANPRFAGDLQATQLAVEMPSTNSGQNGQNTQPQLVHFDSVDATGSYSSSLIAIDHGQLTRGNTKVSLSGSLQAAQGAASPASRTAPVRSSATPAFDENSVLHLHMDAGNVGVDDLQPFVLQKLPITGTLSAQLEADGPVRSLGGSGWVELTAGSLYGEPVNRIRAQGKVVNQVINLDSIAIDHAAGKVSAIGTYDMQSRRFQLDAKAAGLDIARLDGLRRQDLAAAGRLGFSLHASGTFDDPQIEGNASVSNLALGGEPVGGLELVAHTVNHALAYDLTARLDSAEATVHGQTALKEDYETRATLQFSRFNIDSLLKLAHVKDLSGESALAGTITVEGPLAHPEQLHGEARLQELEATVAGVHLKSEGGVHASIANERVLLDPLHVTGEDTDLRAQGSLALKGAQQLDLSASGSINLKLAETVDPDLTADGTTTFQVEAHGPLKKPSLQGRVDFQNGALSFEDIPNGLSQLHGTLEFNQDRLEVKSLTAMSGGGPLSVGGYLSYQHGIYADLSVTGKGVRIRYPQGVSSLADATLHLQGSQNNLLLSGDVLITRFTVSQDMDFAALAAQANGVHAAAAPDSPSSHIRMDVRILSSPQLNFQNAFAKLAGDVDLRLRGTVATPALQGRVSITEGNAMIAGTRYELQRGDITFTNPVRIEPVIDLSATAHVDDYDITLDLHGTPDKLAVTYRSDPPLPESDVVALLALGRTENQQRIYTQQQEQALSNPTTDALLGGALNATVSSRVQKLFGAGSVKVDPNYLGPFGNSTSRIIVEEQLGRNVTLTYATDVNTTGQQLLQAEIAVNRHVSLLVARDESGVFSMVVKATRRFR
ncbi:MAG TPA: translocation/assembly module TamB domain-containing protein [Terracidiphilus sp.]|nr:translocation/assembly module TamB domain-containing protein [Terracidiphilus sp.]